MFVQWFGFSRCSLDWMNRIKVCDHHCMLIRVKSVDLGVLVLQPLISAADEESRFWLQDCGGPREQCQTSLLHQDKHPVCNR